MQPGILDLKQGVDVEDNPYDLRIYQGDTYDSLLVINLPDISSLGRPSTLSGATVSAEIRDASQTLLGQFDVEIVDADERQVRPTMDSATTAQLPITERTATRAYWDLQVLWGGKTDTLIRGAVTITRQETQ